MSKGNVIPLRSEADRIALALKIASERRYIWLLKCLEAERRRHDRTWSYHEWTGEELVGGK